MQRLDLVSGIFRPQRSTNAALSGLSRRIQRNERARARLTKAQVQPVIESALPLRILRGSKIELTVTVK